MTPRFLPPRRLVAALFGTLKLMQMYGRKHDATVDALKNLADSVREAAEDGETRISVRGKRLQVNGRTMRAKECGTLALTFLAEEWIKRGIEHVRMLETVRARDVEVFVAAFLDIDLSRPEPVERLIAALGTGGSKGITIDRRAEEERDPILMEERRESAMRTYLRGLRAFKEVLRLEGVRDRTKLRRARRAVQGVVDSFLEDEAAVLALAQIRSFDLKLFHHSLNVCVFALLIGQRLSMSRRQLGEIGLAALFHDLGKTAAPSGETEEETRLAHPARGARMLLVEGTAHEGMLKAAIAAYEHHVHFAGGGGYPAMDHDPHLVSRIVAVADCYESLVGPGGRGERACSPAEALEEMQTLAGTQLDPLLLKVLVHSLGLYPVGTLVELTTGEVAIVVEGPSDPAQPDKPRVKVVRTDGPGELESGDIVDLTECHETGVAIRQVRCTLPADAVFENAGEHVAAL